MKHFLFFFFYLLENLRCVKKMVMITAYYPLQKSKHSDLEYLKWSSNFFSNVNTISIIYTPFYCAKRFILYNNISMYSTIISHENQLNVTIINLKKDSKKYFVFLTKYKDVNDFQSIKPFINSFDTWQYELDPERKIHSPGLYKIWNSKSWFINNIAKRLIFTKDTIYFWIDIGTLRDRSKTFQNWPNEESLNLYFLSSGYIYVFVQNIPNTNIIVQGGFIGCHHVDCNDFELMTRKEMIKNMKRKLFSGKEQDIYLILAKKYPKKFKALYVPSIKTKLKIDNWLDPFWILLSDNNTKKLYLDNDKLNFTSMENILKNQ